MVRNIPKRPLLNVPLTREEVDTLEQLSKRHRYADFRRQALGLLALNGGRSEVEIAEMLRVSDQPIYNLAKDWREKGLVGILDGHKGGVPVKLTAEMHDHAAEIARQEPLPPARIAARVAEQLPEAPTFSLYWLSVGLKKRGRSFKRTRLSLKKLNEAELQRIQNGLGLMQQDTCSQKIELLYFDEVGFSYLPNVQRGWCSLSMPHTAEACLVRKRAYVMGALDYARHQLHYEICEHSVRRDDVLGFLDRLASTSRRDKWIITVLDNASMHHDIDQSILHRWILPHRFEYLYLPQFRQGLNLIEILGSTLNTTGLNSGPGPRMVLSRSCAPFLKDLEKSQYQLRVIAYF